jgi:chemotaxis protein histidine kinase CheA
MNPAEFIAEFRDEAAEKLDVIASELLGLERDPNNLQAVREMFLAAHTVKGGASMLRLTDIQELAHALEDVLAEFRDRARRLDTSSADLVLQTVDRLRGLVLSASPAAVGAEVDPELLRFIDHLRAGFRPTSPASGDTVEEPRAADAVAPGTPAETRVAAGARQALVVDGSTTVRALHRHLLLDLGYEVDCVADGDQALSRALRASYALVVAGVELAGLSGFELSRALRASPMYAAVPIILVSAEADAERYRQALDAGAHALLRKGAYVDEQLTQTLVELGATEQHTPGNPA